jgi:acyl-CoA synthetase (AMP-forming)/AMP-acid ligase II
MTVMVPQSAATIAAALTARSKREPGRLAIAIAKPAARRPARYEEVSLAELERDVNTCMDVFVHRGIVGGTRTVVMIPPGRDFCATVIALLKIGAPPVFIDPGIGLRNVGHCIRQARPSAFVGTHKAQFARLVLGWGRDSIRIALTPGGDPAGRGPAPPRPVIDPQPCDPCGEVAAIAFTSGSTGPPKGVVFDQANLIAQAQLAAQLMGPCISGPHLATFPMLLLFAPVIGFAAVIPDMDASRPAAADPAKLIGAAGDYRCQSMFASPALVRKLGAYCRDHNRNLPSMERVLSAGAPSHPDALATLGAAISPAGEIFTPYGATEALPVSNLGSREILGETCEKTRSGAGVCVGRVLPGVSAHIIPISEQPFEDWNEITPLPPGEVGEIAVSGGVVSARYDRNPEANRLSKIPFRSGNGFYHRMGDLGYFDELGRLWMCGRKSHRVVTARRLYFTVPCEGVFNSHPMVARTALVGVSDAGGVTPVVCVELPVRKSRQERKRITEELRSLGAQFEHTRDIRHFLYLRSFPVDARHNSKIRREVLAVWANKRIRARPAGKET